MTTSLNLYSHASSSYYYQTWLPAVVKYLSASSSPSSSNRSSNEVWISVFIEDSKERHKARYDVSRTSAMSMAIHKFSFLNRVLSNTFLAERYKDAFLDFFGTIQRHMFIWIKLVRKYKYWYTIVHKKAMFNTADLSMNELFVDPPATAATAAPSKKCVCILEGAKWYVFTRYDIVNFMNSSLGNAQDFFTAPLVVRNPYTNVPISKNNLYNFYFFLKSDGHFPTLPLIDAFFRHNFDRPAFVSKNNVLLRQCSLLNFINSASMDDLVEYITDMLIDIRFDASSSRSGGGGGGGKSCVISLPPEFPKQRAVEIFRPYLHLFLQMQYSLDSCLVNESKKEIKIRLYHFYYFNPRFGKPQPQPQTRAGAGAAMRFVPWSCSSTPPPVCFDFGGSAGPGPGPSPSPSPSPVVFNEDHIPYSKTLCSDQCSFHCQCINTYMDSLKPDLTTPTSIPPTQSKRRRSLLFPANTRSRNRDRKNSHSHSRPPLFFFEFEHTNDFQIQERSI